MTETGESSGDPFAALGVAIREGDVSGARELFDAHPNLSDRLGEPIPGGHFGALAIMNAVDGGRLDVVDLLLEHGADINALSHWWAGGFCVLETCRPELAPALVERGVRVTAHAAARLGLIDELRTLLDADAAVVHARGGDGKTPLHYASTIAIADLLLERGADIDLLDVDHESTPAQYLVREHSDVARHLVERGCSTDILLATALGLESVVRRILDQDPAAIRTRVNGRWFPMRNARAGGPIYTWTIGSHKSAHAVARELGHSEILALLLARSPAAVTLADAYEAGDEERVRGLLAASPDLAHQLEPDDMGRLAEAAFDGNDRAVTLMLDAGWPVDARGSEGATALHGAAWHGNAVLVAELLRRGAATAVKEPMFNGTALDWARHGMHNSWKRAKGDYATTITLLSDEDRNS